MAYEYGFHGFFRPACLYPLHIRGLALPLLIREYMIQNQDIICFANDWNSDPLSKKHVMLRLAKHNRVLWINSIGNRNPTASVYDLKRIVKKLRDFSLGCRQ